MKFETQEQFTAWCERTPAGKRHSAASETATERDRIWFERHPVAESYTRRAIADEFPPTEPQPAKATLVLVHQIRPGVRMRTPISKYAVKQMERSPIAAALRAAMQKGFQ